MAKRREVLLSFALRNLQAAEGTAKRVIAMVQKSKDLAKEVRRELITNARERLKEIRAERAAALEQERLAKRATALRNRDLDSTLSFEAGNRIRRGINKADQLAEEIKSGNVTGALLEALGDAPGIVGIAAKITAQITQYVDERIEEKAERLSERMSARLEAQRYEADYQRRLEEEPGFRASEARKAWEQTKANERAYAEGGWSRSADYMGSF